MVSETGALNSILLEETFGGASQSNEMIELERGKHAVEVHNDPNSQDTIQISEQPIVDGEETVTASEDDTSSQPTPGQRVKDACQDDTQEPEEEDDFCDATDFLFLSLQQQKNLTGGPLEPDQQAVLEQLYFKMVETNKRRKRQEGSSTEEESQEPAKHQKVNPKMDIG